MSKFDNFIHHSLVKRIFSIILAGLILYLFKGMLNLLLLIFIITFIFGQLQKFLYDKINSHIHISRKLVTVIMYVVIVTFFTVTGIMYIPKVSQQLIDAIQLISTFNVDKLKGKINLDILNLISEEQINLYIKEGASYLLQLATTIGTFSFNFAISFLISFLFLLEKDEIVAFGKNLEHSKIAFLYRDMKHYGNIFLNSFGKVIELQIVIAFINSFLSVIALSIMGFPQALGLGLMIFILGLIPVAGVIISLVPLVIMAFNIGGTIKIIEVIVMIIVLHALESYVLNPKLMSAKTKIPVFIVFLILLISEHYLGIWGLLFGIPLFMFFLDVLDIKVRE
ncbi:AI-2E family transporter [Anaeromicropila herbilytica]|uniref:AI-2E family transporter n=1 Tax=Anaeromicropila herbilytica TaxID=2785025 RepID=A0A7R7ICL3_9FIRM|nr:AI-2E family transporter [Anaeromicropila herbilytica]BCN29108.1 AI-2E family transporter [Anaeromicropila herbilytica]